MEKLDTIFPGFGPNPAVYSLSGGSREIAAKQAWNYTKAMASVAPGLGLGAPSKVSYRL